MIRRVLVAVIVMLLAACGSDGITVSVPRPTTTTDATPSSTDPTPAPDLGESPLPIERPTDFEASFAQDGGMAPWSEEITIGDTSATYAVWMDGVEFTFLHTPAPERVDALYDELRAGRFDLYEVIPFGEDEMLYDAGSASWRVRAADFSHRIAESGEEIVGPSTGRRPLGAISGFSDADAVPGAVFTATIVVDDAAAGRWGTDIEFDLGSADFAFGDDRWTQELVVSFSESPLEVPVTVRLDADGADPVERSTVVTFVDGGTISIESDDAGGLTVS